MELIPGSEGLCQGPLRHTRRIGQLSVRITASHDRRSMGIANNNLYKNILPAPMFDPFAQKYSHKIQASHQVIASLFTIASSPYKNKMRGKPRLCYISLSVYLG